MAKKSKVERDPNTMTALKIRIYPNQDQQSKLTDFFGARRWIYNTYLAEQKQRYNNKQKHLSHFDINKDITQIKQQYQWLYQIDDWVLKFAAEDLTTAFQNFFKSVTGKRKGPKILS